MSVNLGSSMAGQIPPQTRPNPDTRPRVDCIVVTCSSNQQREAVLHELHRRQHFAGSIDPRTLVLAVADPDGQRIGSGNATLLALHQARTVLVQQRRRSRQQHALARSHAADDKDDDVYFAKQRILILHSGGDSQRIPICSVRGKAFSALPACFRYVCAGEQYKRGELAPAAPIDFLIRSLSVAFGTRRSNHASSRECDGGAIISCTDVLIFFPQLGIQGAFEQTQSSHNGRACVVALAIPVPLEVGARHGVFVLDGDAPPEKKGSEPYTAPVTNILQKASPQELKRAGAEDRVSGKCMLDGGVIYYSGVAMCTFAALAKHKAFSGAFASGLDAGVPALRVELFTDVLYPLNSAHDHERYVNGDDDSSDALKCAREALWTAFRGMAPLQGLVIPGTEFCHIGTTEEYSALLTRPPDVFRTSFGLSQYVHAFVRYPALCAKNDAVVLINCALLGRGTVAAGAVVENCVLKGRFCIEEGAICSNVRFSAGIHCAPGIVRTEVLVLQPSEAQAPDGWPSSAASLRDSPLSHVKVVFGVKDAVKLPFTLRGATFCNRPWKQFFARARGIIQPCDIWYSGEPQNLWNAHLFPVISASNAASTGDRLLDVMDWVNWMQYEDDVPQDVMYQWKCMERLSLKGIMRIADNLQEAQWRDECSFLVDIHRLEFSLWNDEVHDPVSMIDLVRRSALSNRTRILRMLDRVAANSPIGVACRALALEADALRAYCDADITSGVSIGLRGDHDCRGAAWRKAYELLSARSCVLSMRRDAAVAELALVRDSLTRVSSVHAHEGKILYDSNSFARASSHYEGAYRRLIATAINVGAAQKQEEVEKETVTDEKGFVDDGRNSEILVYDWRGDLKTKLGVWVHVQSPVRIDLAGGWSDTPPITYEYGSRVVNVATQIDGMCPIGASARIFLVNSTRHACVIFRIARSRPDDVHQRLYVNRAPVSSNGVETGAAADVAETTVECFSFADMDDHCVPTAPASLLKCCLIVLDVIDRSRRQHSASLRDQIHDRLCRGVESMELRESAESKSLGLEVRSWSTLPNGTGLGVSSALAACVIASMTPLFGMKLSRYDLCMAVLRVEQLLTTGGGWQDQVGTVFAGFKCTTAKPALPLRLRICLLDVPHVAMKVFNSHVVLIHSGTCRLAKGLLQNVIRRWYRRSDDILSVVDELVSNAVHARDAVMRGEMSVLGSCMSSFFKQKISMASSHEGDDGGLAVVPGRVRKILACLAAYLDGAELAGSGGGGFIVAVTKRRRTEVLGEMKAALAVLEREERNRLGCNVEEYAYRMYLPSICHVGLHYCY